MIAGWSTSSCPGAESLPDRLGELLPASVDTMKIRHHGDFHLGQMLIVKDDVCHHRFRRRAATEHRGSPSQGAGRARRRRPHPFDRLFRDRRAGARAQVGARRAGQARPRARRMARAVGRGLSRRLPAIIGRHQALAAVAGRCRSPARFLPAGEGVLRDRLRACASAGLAARAARRHLAHSRRARRPAGMSSLSPEAYAVIEGRHSDPFHYLGPHVEGDVPARARFPSGRRGSRNQSMSDGHECGLQRIHDAGLFEGRLSNGSRRYRVRARYGERQVEIEDPYRFPPILSDLDLYLLGEGTHMHLYEKLGAHPMIAGRSCGRCICGVRTQRPPRQRSGRFQFLGRPAPRHARARQRLLGNLCARGQGRRPLQIRDHRARRPHAAAEVRSAGVRSRVAARDGIDRRGPGRDPASAARAAGRQRVACADFDLRSASRLMAAPAARRRPLADLS